MTENETVNLHDDAEGDDLTRRERRLRLAVVLSGIGGTAFLALGAYLRSKLPHNAVESQIVFGLGYTLTPIMMLAVVGLPGETGRHLFRLCLLGLVWLDAAFLLGCLAVPFAMRDMLYMPAFGLMACAFAAHGLGCWGVSRLLALRRADEMWQTRP